MLRMMIATADCRLAMIVDCRLSIYGLAIDERLTIAHQPKSATQNRQCPIVGNHQSTLRITNHQIFSQLIFSLHSAVANSVVCATLASVCAISGWWDRGAGIGGTRPPRRRVAERQPSQAEAVQRHGRRRARVERALEVGQGVGGTSARGQRTREVQQGLGVPGVVLDRLTKQLHGLVRASRSHPDNARASSWRTHRRRRARGCGCSVWLP